MITNTTAYREVTKIVPQWMTAALRNGFVKSQLSCSGVQCHALREKLGSGRRVQHRERKKSEGGKKRWQRREWKEGIRENGIETVREGVGKRKKRKKKTRDQEEKAREL